MRLIRTSLLASAVLACGISASTTALANPVFAYKVTVVTSFGTKFTDCFSFHNGTLTIGGLGTLVYAPSPTQPKFYYSAVTTPAEATALGYSYDFAGFKRGTLANGVIHAVGSDSIRDTYTVNGVTDAACAAGAVSPTNLYAPAAK